MFVFASEFFNVFFFSLLEVRLPLRVSPSTRPARVVCNTFLFFIPSLSVLLRKNWRLHLTNCGTVQVASLAPPLRPALCIRPAVELRICSSCRTAAEVFFPPPKKQNNLFSFFLFFSFFLSCKAARPSGGAASRDRHGETSWCLYFHLLSFSFPALIYRKTRFHCVHPSVFSPSTSSFLFFSSSPVGSA